MIPAEIYTLHQYLLRTENITYILMVAILFGFIWFYKALTENEKGDGPRHNP